MLKRLLMAGALLLSSCTRTQTVTRYVTPTPCHLAEMPVLPDIGALATPDGKFVGFTVPDFTQLVEWVREVQEWHDVVMTCPYVTQEKNPLKEVMGVGAGH